MGASEQAARAWWDGHKGPHPAWLPRSKGSPSLALAFGGRGVRVDQGSSVKPRFAGSGQCRGMLQLGKCLANVSM